MKKTNKIITIIMLVAILTMSLFVSTVYAATNTVATVKTPGTVTVTKNVTGVTNPVTNTFGYTIAADTTYNPAEVTDYPTSASISFSNAIPSNGQVSNDTTVDFSGAKFTKVGDYRFKITETSSTKASKYPVDSSYYYLYVSVRFTDDDTDGTKKEATVASSGVKDSENDERAQTNPGTKQAVVFTTEPDFTSLTISKTVTGNMGDKSEYFTVNVTIPGESGDTYVVSGGKYGAATSSTKTVAAGTATALEIKHGETLTIGIAKDGTTKQVPVGAQYTVAETAVTGYTTTIDTVEQNTTTKTTVKSDATDAATKNATAIVNHYELSTLTGVFFNIMPYALIAVAVIILILLVKRSSKKREE